MAVKTPDLSIIIVNYNAKKYIIKCLESIVMSLGAPGVSENGSGDAAGKASVAVSGGVSGKALKASSEETARWASGRLKTEKFLWEALVVDNASDDGSTELVEEFIFAQATGTGKAACTGTGKSIYKDSCEGRDEFTGWQASRASACKIKLICQRENLGFAEASNTGAQNSTGRYLLFLNPDTELVQRGLEKMVDFLDERNRQTKVGITGAKLLNSDGTLQFSCRAFPTLARQMYESFFLHRVFPGSRVFGSYFLTWWDHAHERQVDWLSGAFMLCSREVFLNAGGFDRDYFMYCEDTDICLKLSRKGYTNYYYPDYMLIHADAGIASKDNALRNCQIWQSRELYFRKNYGYAHAKAFSLLYFLFSLNRVLLFYTLSFFKPGDKALRPRARQYMQSICMYFKKKYK